MKSWIKVRTQQGGSLLQANTRKSQENLKKEKVVKIRKAKEKKRRYWKTHSKRMITLEERKTKLHCQEKLTLIGDFKRKSPLTAFQGSVTLNSSELPAAPESAAPNCSGGWLRSTKKESTASKKN